MNIILFDGKEYSDLLPLTFTRPVAELRMGILTFAERWKLIFQTEKISYLTQRYLSEKYTLQNEEENVFINPAYFPNQDFIFQLKNLKFGEAFYYQEELVAAKTTLENFQLNKFVKKLDITFLGFHIQYPWDLFTYNSDAITYDFQLITQGRKSCTLSNTVRIIGDPSQLFVEEGAVAECAIFNTKEGPIYLGKNSEIMEGAMIRGSFALGTGSKINMGAKVYGGTTVGPYSKVGGEVNNIIILGYTNKGHDGFVGNSIIGEWCNLGADTNSSNLKNNYAEVKLWNYTKQKFIKSGLQFAGMIMGDHSKSAINTQFNTGTVVGVSANIFTSGFPPNIIKSFSWGGKSESPSFKLEQVFEVAERTMKRRGIELSEQDKKIIEYIYNNY